MNLTVKFAIYLIIIASEIDYLWSRPVDVKSKRQKRQVVQPKWLLNPELPFGDSKVHVTDDSLKEVADIRAAIKKAIESGTFAVNFDKPNKPPSTTERSKPTTERSKPKTEKPFPKFEMPEFEMPEFDMSLFNLSDFGIPELDVSEFDPSEFFEPEQRISFFRQMSKLWQNFWDNSHKVLNSFN